MITQSRDYHLGSFCSYCKKARRICSLFRDQLNVHLVLLSAFVQNVLFKGVTSALIIMRGTVLRPKCPSPRCPKGICHSVLCAAHNAHPLVRVVPYIARTHTCHFLALFLFSRSDAAVLTQHSCTAVRAKQQQNQSAVCSNRLR